MKKKKQDWTTRNEKKTDKNALRSKDVAHMLDCSPDDVIELARKGKLEAYKVGRFWRFKQKDVLKYKKEAE
jgi:excisionase family DNA binding protein